MSDTPPKFGTFTVADQPTDTAPKPRRGRPPGSTNKPKAASTVSAADVKKAMAVLDSGYSLITTGLVVVGLTDSATAWVESAEALNKTNEDALLASPKITKAIISTGDVGGSLTFLLTHGMALATLARAVNTELAAKAAARAKEMAADNTAAVTPSDFDPAYVPGL